MNSRDTTALLEWYKKEKRDLPWRNTNDPYAIWLSEVILQQTRVDQGMAYYHKLLGHYPTVNDLANAHQDEVLSLWQGLGYYSRGRNLHATAKKIQELGNFPSTYTSLLELKGIGPYTAAAIASFAFGERVAVLDGNVFRVITRFLASDLPIDKGTTRKTFQSLLNEWIPAHAPADFNQAMMELGATVCTRQNPACLMCPVRHFCAATKQGEPHAFPRLAPKQIEHRSVTRLWCQRDGALLLHRAAAEARRLALQHELPSAAHLGLTEVAAAKGTLLATKKRGITRYRITESIYTCAAPRGKLADELVWVALPELSSITLSGPHRRWITEIIERA